MSRLSSHLLALLFLLSTSAIAAAQVETVDESEASDVSERLAFELLETIAEGIPSLRTSENRVYLTIVVADLFWSKDEKRARGLFDTVTRETVSAVSALDPSNQEFYNDFGMIQQQRREIIDRMVRHDPQMAMAFLRATRLPLALESAQHRTIETQLELHLAGLVAETDPAQALRLARRRLREGISYSVVQLLSQISAKDQVSARSLHGEIVDQLKTEDLSRNHEVSNTAWNLLTSYQPPAAKEETYRELIELLVGAALSVTPRDSVTISTAQNYYGQLRSALPEIEKYAPGRVPAVRQWIGRVQRTQDPGTRMYEELNELSEKGTVEDFLSLAEKYRSEFQLEIYQRAASKALSSGDPNRARQIISEFVSDPVQRRQMLEQIDSQLAWTRVQEMKVAETRGLLSRIKGVEQQVNILMSLAMNVASKGDKKQALELLAEARTLLDLAPADANKLTMRLQLAENYSFLDSEQSAALLEFVIRKLNRLVDAAVVLDGFEQRYLKDGEWVKGHHSTLGGVIYKLSQSLGQLARFHPASARYLSNQLERPEIRLMIQLEIAQSVLAYQSLGRSRRSRLIVGGSRSGRP